MAMCDRRQGERRARLLPARLREPRWECVRLRGHLRLNRNGDVLF